MRFAGRCGIVTGGAAGIGAAVARRLALEGCHVIILDCARCPDGLDESAFTWVEGDVTIHSDRTRATDIVAQRFGSLQVLVNNAGISFAGRIEDGDASVRSSRVLEVNLGGTIHMSGVAIPLMKASPHGAAIVNIASIGARVANPPIHPSYAASKGGQIALTHALAAGYGQYGIRCNAILPGAVRTELWTQLSDDTRKRYADLHPLGIGEVTDVAALVAFLASDEGRWISGAEIVIDGGNISSGGLAAYAREVL